MTTDEKRACRRELINKVLHLGHMFKYAPQFTFPEISYIVRREELYRYNQSLNIYSTEG